MSALASTRVGRTPPRGSAACDCVCAAGGRLQPMTLHLRMALRGEHSWLVRPVQEHDLSECCRVCQVQWTQEKDSDILSFWRVKVETPCQATRRRYCVDAARGMLAHTHDQLDQFIHGLLCRYQTRLSSLDVDARQGWLTFVLRSDPNGLEKCKEMLSNWQDVLGRFAGHFSPAWFQEEEGCRLVCVCQPVKFQPDAEELRQNFSEMKISEEIDKPPHEEDLHISNVGEGSDCDEDLEDDGPADDPNDPDGLFSPETPPKEAATSPSVCHPAALEEPQPAERGPAVREDSFQAQAAAWEERSEFVLSEFDVQADELREQARQHLRRMRIPDTDILVMSLMHALFEESKDTPRAKTLDTVLVLDCSDSMRGEPLATAKKAALKFLEAVEMVAEERGLEENVAVVAMGNNARVVQHLTNDYQRVRHAIEGLTAGGLSPLLEALCVTTAECRKFGGVVNASGCHRIPPRVLLFTDGHATDEGVEAGHDPHHADANVKIRLIRLVQHMLTQSHGPRPLVWVPLGADPGREFMKSLVSLSKGACEMVEPSEVHRTADYFFLQDAVAKVYKCASHVGGSREQVEAVVPALVERLSSEQRVRVVDEVMKKIANKGANGEGKATDWDNMRERPELPPLGTRVIRGPDWKWQNQDTEGPGTVINHDERRYLAWVTWDNGTTNCYRCGLENAYDVLPVDACQFPRPEVPGETIDIGHSVLRGADWEYGDQDGGPGQMGVVIRKKEGLVKVRWPNGHINRYRFGKDGKHDVKICSTGLSSTQAECCRPGLSLHAEDELLDQPGDPLWQWLGSGDQWTDFESPVSDNIERAFSKNLRSCLTRHNDTMYRVLFSKMIARASEHADRLPVLQVRRIVV